MGRIEYFLSSNHPPEASLEEVCDGYPIPERTLARRLREEGATLTGIPKELRRERTKHLIRDTELPLKRVAPELGFNGDASFNMAFKSWTDTTPLQFARMELADLPPTMTCPVP
jgi:AraC-like DNA-binding protein